ncbi:MAG: serine hydrolase [Streptosporangiales bacterium]|nr:serine hydrolase [Streptosporangiales bacterium]
MLRRALVVLLAVLVSVAAVFAVGTVPATARPSHDPRHDSLQRELDRAVADDGAPGILAGVRDGHGAWFGSAGVADLESGRKRRPVDRFRVGSTTKTFTATVVLQLAAEKRLSLDDSVEKWLPGLVQGNGHDGGKITIRQLLNHTSGIFNYTADPELSSRLAGESFLEHRFDTYTPEQLVEIAVANPPAFAPGASWGYSNTNYILAGMIIEKVTGRSYAAEVNRRIIRPLGLIHTYLPGDDPTVRRPRGRGYSKLFLTDPDAKIHDVTKMSPTWGWAAGEMISTAGDLNRFFAALMGGRLLPPAQGREMFTGVPTKDFIPDSTYGLGVLSQRLPCGVTVWGHGGTIHGSLSWTSGTRHGGHLLTVNINGDWVDQVGISTRAATAEFCPNTSTDKVTNEITTWSPAPLSL